MSDHLEAKIRKKLIKFHSDSKSETIFEKMMMMRPPEPESVKVKKDRDEDTKEHNNNALLEGE